MHSFSQYPKRLHLGADLELLLLLCRNAVDNILKKGPRQRSTTQQAEYHNYGCTVYGWLSTDGVII
jgi:hypothetical protein